MLASPQPIIWYLLQELHVELVRIEMFTVFPISQDTLFLPDKVPPKLLIFLTPEGQILERMNKLKHSIHRHYVTKTQYSQTLCD